MRRRGRGPPPNEGQDATGHPTQSVARRAQNSGRGANQPLGTCGARPTRDTPRTTISEGRGKDMVCGCGTPSEICCSTYGHKNCLLQRMQHGKSFLCGIPAENLTPLGYPDHQSQLAFCSSNPRILPQASALGWRTILGTERDRSFVQMKKVWQLSPKKKITLTNNVILEMWPCAEYLGR